MRRESVPSPGTPLIGVVLLFSAIFRAIIFLSLLYTRTWSLGVIGLETVGLIALTVGTLGRKRWAKAFATVYLVISTLALLVLWFFSPVRNVALLDILINLMLIWYIGAPDAEMRNT